MQSPCQALGLDFIKYFGGCLRGFGSADKAGRSTVKPVDTSRISLKFEGLAAPGEGNGLGDGKR